MAKIERGEGNVGKLINDEKLYADARDTIETFRPSRRAWSAAKARPDCFSRTSGSITTSTPLGRGHEAALRFPPEPEEVSFGQGDDLLIGFI